MGKQGQKREITASSVCVTGGWADLAQPRQPHDISQQIITELPGISMSTVNFSLMKNVVLTAPGAGLSLPTEEFQAMEQHWRIHLCSGWDPIEAWGDSGIDRAPSVSPCALPLTLQGPHWLGWDVCQKSASSNSWRKLLVTTSQLQMQIWGSEVWFYLGTSSTVPFTRLCSSAGSAGPAAPEQPQPLLLLVSTLRHSQLFEKWSWWQQRALLESSWHLFYTLLSDVMRHLL